MKLKKYKIVKNIPTPDGPIVAGSEIMLIGNNIYFNDVLLMPEFYDLFKKLIQTEETQGFNYLKPMTIPHALTKGRVI